jgi:hypothetical protein
MDLRNDQKTKDELKKTNQSPVTVEQVRNAWTQYASSHQLYDSIKDMIQEHKLTLETIGHKGC